MDATDATLLPRNGAGMEDRGREENNRDKCQPTHEFTATGKSRALNVKRHKEIFSQGSRIYDSLITRQNTMPRSTAPTISQYPGKRILP